MTTLRVESLRLGQGAFVLRDVSFAVAEGECLALLGPSGSGKTTCLEIMAGLRGADAGRVWIGGRDVTGVPAERREVSYLPQDVALFPHLSVRGNILFAARMRRLAPDAERWRQLCTMLDIVPLLDRADVRSLSGGEAQRVAIARALVVPPQVLFLDECFGALDAPLRRRLARQFRDLRKLTGTTTVLVTHDTDEACLMADRLAVLHRGAVEQVGTPDELHFRPATVQVAELLGMHNILPVRSSRRTGEGWRCQVGGVELLAAGQAPEASPPRWLGFFGSDIRVARPVAEAPRGHAANLVRARVVDGVRQGQGALLRLAIDGEPSTVFEGHWRDEGGALPAPNDMVEVRLPADRIHCWPAPEGEQAAERA